MRLSRLVVAAGTALSALTAVVVVVATPPASAAVADGAVFNNPLIAAEQYRIRDHVRTLINAAPSGSTIRIAMYHFRDTLVANDLIAAKNRNVNVRLVVDASDAAQPAVQSLIGALGSNRAAASYLVLCTTGAACIGNAGSPIMHNKFYLFSSTSGSTNVVVQSSANLTPDNATKYWNNAVTLAGNTGLYNAYVDYFNDLAAKVKNSNYYTTIGSGNAKVYFFPRAGSDESTDTIYNMLNENITCEGNTSVGTADTHRTIIRIGMWYFSRDDIARKLRQLADQKCWIDVIYTVIDDGSKGHLINHSRIALYQFPENAGNPYVIHSKYMAIEGTYAGEKDTKWVMTGSHNYTTSALRENDETLLRIKSNAIFDQYRANFRTARAAANTVEPSAAE